MATILAFGANDAAKALLASALPSTDEIVFVPQADAVTDLMGDMAILFDQTSAERVEQVLARFEHAQTTPTLLIVAGAWVGHGPEHLPVTAVHYAPISAQGLSDWVDQQRSLSSALKAVDEFEARMQIAEITGEKCFDMLLEHEVRRFKRYGGALSLMAIRFSGNRSVIHTVSSHLRDVDVITRTSADTALMLLPGTPENGAAALAVRLGASIPNTAYAYGEAVKDEPAIDFMTRVVSKLDG